jgi:hypothetical protein
MVAEPDADAPLGRSGPGEDAVGEVVRAEGIALGDVEGGHRVVPRFRGRARCVIRVIWLGRVIRAVHVWVFHVFRVVAAQVTGE